VSGSFIALIGSILSFYGIVVYFRRARLQKAATALDATYTAGSWGRPARIVGQHFKIEIARIGKAFTTSVEVRTRSSPCRALFYPQFFEKYPDWEYARVLSPHEERLFVVRASILRYGVPTEKQKRVLWSWLNRGSAARHLSDDLLKKARIKRIVVGDDHVSTSFGGIVTNITRLRYTLAALEPLAFEESVDSTAAARGVIH
jgi:hypothetical protein